MAHSSTYLQRGPSLPGWLVSPFLPPAQTAILLSLLTVAAAIIFFGSALWKDAKSGAYFSGSGQHLFWLMDFFCTTHWSCFTEWLHFTPLSRPHFMPSRTDLTCGDFSRKRSEGLSSPVWPFVSEGVREDALSPKTVSTLSDWMLLTDCLYSGSSATAVFCWCFSSQCNSSDCGYCHDHVSYVPIPATRHVNGIGRGSSGWWIRSEIESPLYSSSFSLLIKAEGVFWWDSKLELRQEQYFLYLVVKTENCYIVEMLGR